MVQNKTMVAASANSASFHNHQGSLDTDRYLMNCLLDGKRREASERARTASIEINTRNNPPPNRRQIDYFQAKAHTLDSLWRRFRANFLNMPRQELNTELISFLTDLTNYYDREVRIPNHRPPLNDELETAMEGSGIKLTEISHIVNKNIPIEVQEKFWYSLDTSRRDKIINEQKHKYGTLAFTHKYMPRIVTEKTREKYIEQITLNRSFEDAGFKFLGLGFGGAAFLVDASDPESINYQAAGSNIPKYVLKVPAAGKYTNRSQAFSPINKERAELVKLTIFSLNYENQTGHEDYFSQRLACYRTGQGSEAKYVSLVPKGLGERVLATIFQKGQNVYQTAHSDNKGREIGRTLARRIGSVQEVYPGEGEFENNYVTVGLAINKIVELIQYYTMMAEAKINFYDLFPHNMHYLAKERSLCFVDACSTRGKVQKNIIEARHAFPLDMCIFDLLTFIVMQEQDHAIPAAIRKNAQEMIKSALIKLGLNHRLSNSTENKRFIKEIYRDYRESRFKQIRDALEMACSNESNQLSTWGGKQALFSLEQLCSALNRLTSFDNYDQVYGHHYKTAMKKDFDRLMENTPDPLLPTDESNVRGGGYLIRLRDYFNQKLMAQQLTNPEPAERVYTLTA